MSILPGAPYVRAVTSSARVESSSSVQRLQADPEPALFPFAAGCSTIRRSAGARAAPPINRAKRTAIFTRLRAENPEPTTELDFRTHFELLIAVMLSAQATDVGLNRATAKLFPAARTPAAMLELGLDRLKDFIRTIGLFNTKAKNILKTCRILLDGHGGEVPRRRASRWRHCPASAARRPTWC